MVLEGGKRDRMVAASFFQWLKEGADQLGWLEDPAISGADHSQVYIVEGPIADNETIPPNTVVVTIEDIDYEDVETGSNSQRATRMGLVDIYAEDDIVGQHLRGDLSAMCRGHMASIGYDDPGFEIFDYDQATPSAVGAAEIASVRDERARGGTQEWERHWFSIMAVIEDEAWVDLP